MNTAYIPTHLRQPIPYVRCAPGIYPDEPYVYKTVSFAATREYGPDEGWIRVVRNKKKRRQVIRRAAWQEAVAQYAQQEA
jgi:hypothetical protein